MTDFESGSQFLTTRWTRILDSSGNDDESVPSALTMLCQDYYLPVLVFIQNRCGDAEQARDHCQGFFEYLIETKLYSRAVPGRGRFRSFLLTAVKNYLSNEHRNASRQRRGGAQVHLPIGDDDFLAPELASQIPPDSLFDQQWALTIFKNVWILLRKEYESLGQVDRFEALRPTIMNPGAAFEFDEVSEKLGMTPSGAKSAAFRLKSRFRMIFREVVAQLVDSPGEVDEEVHYLIEAMSFSAAK